MPGIPHYIGICVWLVGFFLNRRCLEIFSSAALTKQLRPLDLGIPSALGTWLFWKKCDE
jgi:hypothetical protein